MNNVVEMKDITKRFPGIIANSHVNFDLRQGEIHALLGENGAGKSTLMSVLFGLYQAEEGEILIRGEKVDIKDPNVATKIGIGMVHQHFKLVHNLSITENIILGVEPKNRWHQVDLKKGRAQVVALSEKYGLTVDPDELIENITVGMQQRVEILKMLYRNSNILIFDEPTAVLTPQEIEDLIIVMRNLVKEGKSIILITHKLKEIMAIADRCTVLRRGKCISTVEVAKSNPAELAEMMVGRKVNLDLNKKEIHEHKTVMKIRNLSVKDSKGLDAVKNFNLDVRTGEIMCVAGIDGNGQSELIQGITGLTPCSGGTIEFLGKEIQNSKIRERTEMGLGHIPEDRQKYGLVMDFDVKENMVLQSYFKEPFSTHGKLNKEAIKEYSDKLVEEYDVRSSQGSDTTSRSLSGGNQQKAIIAREVDRSPALLLAAQPTRGLDVGAIEFIHKSIVAERDKGKAVLLFSLELEEVLSLSDKIAVIYEGEIVGVLDAKDATENELGLLMSGAKKGDLPDYE
ncbi:MAG: ABC transporter ATP-binding protein [Sphaerochaeta sp.]